MFTKNLSIFVLLLTTFSLFNHGKAISSPLFRRTLLPESSPPALDVLENLPPNAKRLALGLPPLAPFRRWTPSATDNIVKRAEPSPVPFSGKIRVDSSTATLGYVSSTLEAGHYTLAATQAAGGTFSFSAKPNGKTSTLNIRRNTGLFTSGIITPGTSLSSTSSNSARLGESNATPAGSTPQSNASPTLPGDAETAIWAFTANTGALEPGWVNYDRSTPKTSIMYVPNTATFHLSGSPAQFKSANPTAVEVTFTLV